MSIDSLKEALPEYAKDLKLNLGALPTLASLSEQQLWGTLLSSAIAARGEMTLAAIAEEAAKHLSPEAVRGSKAAAAMMAMNNVYYRFTHLSSNQTYTQLPARLRMSIIANPGVDALDFELWCLAVSAVNGCGQCMDSHEHVVIEKGATVEMVQDAVRAASIVHAVAVTLEAEDQLYSGGA